ncbi:TetR/AcrR family transcriptional regulator [Kitasatospora sp. NPDC088346]|uniref:TetR/AcrR family transcriptional regulator n=1 Tax=Kitasatospora sp. NPDC088346 TaxID=3364073 RepID=UPI00380C98B8
MDLDDLPLRERKKQQTRQRISAVATALFVARGFDEVPVAEVAEAAEVSKMTVFNYFPRKEELFLDRVPEALTLLDRTVGDRPAGQDVLPALRDLMLRLAEQDHPFAAIGARHPAFWRTVLASPALRAYARESVEALEEHLAGLLLAEGRDEPTARFTAALAVTALRTVFTGNARRLLAGDPAEAVAADHPGFTRRTFGAVERALAAFTAPSS